MANPDSARIKFRLEDVVQADNSLYGILGIARDAGTPQIKAAFYLAAKKWHPDIPGGDKGKFIAAKQAYDILINPATRKRYDKSLALLDRPAPKVDDMGVSSGCYSASAQVFARQTQQSWSSGSPQPPLAFTVFYTSAPPTKGTTLTVSWDFDTAVSFPPWINVGATVGINLGSPTAQGFIFNIFTAHGALGHLRALIKDIQINPISSTQSNINITLEIL